MGKCEVEVITTANSFSVWTARLTGSQPLHDWPFRIFCKQNRGTQVSIEQTRIFLVQANASEQLGTVKAREKSKKSYEQALVKRYHHLHEVKRIERHRHLPASIYKVSLIFIANPGPPKLSLEFLMFSFHRSYNASMMAMYYITGLLLA